MSISEEAIRYVVLTRQTEDDSINIPNMDRIVSQPPWRHAVKVWVEINETIIEAEYQFGGHPVCVSNEIEDCITFPEGILVRDSFKADIKLDAESGQKYLRTPEDFYKIWESDPRIATAEVPLPDPAEANWTGGCIIC